MTVELVYKEIYFADNTTGLAAFAFDGENYYPVSMQVDNTGALITDASGLPVAIVGTVPVSLAGSVAVTGTFWQATQPISAASLPLPAGAATAAIQTSILSALGTPLQAGGTVSISGTTAVSASSLPLPSGASTASLQNSILTALGSPMQQSGGSVSISGTVPVSATSLPLPTGAAQDGTDGTGITPPAGATGIRGWLSGIFKALSNVINVSIQSLNFPASSGNTSSAQLAPGASFTGALDTVLNLQAAQVEVFSDQPFQLVINQYIDAAGAELSSSDVFVVSGSAPFNYNQNISLPGNYFNVVVTNLGSAATTALAINTTYGIMATGPRTVTGLGNNRTALNEIGGTGLTAGQKVSAASVPVVLASDQSPVTITDPVTVGATSSDAPIFTAITGDPNGDFAGINLLEQAMNSSGDLGFNVRVQNPLAADANNAAIPSDIPQTLTFSGPVGAIWLIDTKNYQSVEFSTQALVGTVTASSDLINWISLSGVNLTLGPLVSALTANSAFWFPAAARYIRVTVTTAGSATAILRQTPWNAGYVANATTNVAQIGGTATVSAGVAGMLAVGGNIAAGTAPTANPIYVAGLDTTAKTRPLLTDPAGHLLNASPDTVGIAPLVSPQGAAGTDVQGLVRRIGVIADPVAGLGVMATQDRGTAEGMTIPELLFQVLRELQVMNQQIFDIKVNSGAGADEPSAYRNDPSIFN